MLYLQILCKLKCMSPNDPTRKEQSEKKSRMNVYREEEVSVIRMMVCGVLTFGYVILSTKPKKM